MLDAARLIDRPDRRAEVLLYLADVAPGHDDDFPSAGILATEAWEASPATDPLRMLKHGVPASDLASAVFGSDVAATLRATTSEVLRDNGADRPDIVRRWLTQLALARELDPQWPTGPLPELEGVGFYRAWLRFAVAPGRWCDPPGCRCLTTGDREEALHRFGAFKAEPPPSHASTRDLIPAGSRSA